MRESVRKHPLTTFLWLATGGIVLFYLRQLWEGRRGQLTMPHTHTEEPQPLPVLLPHVTIIVPARNEQRNIRRCILSLLHQTYAAFNIIVVDDGSTDTTSTILAELQHGPRGELLSVIAAGDLPLGWAGKPHALAVGAAIAIGEWLLFTDADTYHSSGALAYAMTTARHTQADLCSLLTRQELIDPWNHMVLPIVIMGITAQYPPAMIANPRRQAAIANGQYLLIRHAVYTAVGGYAGDALRGSVVDDRDLAALVKQSGYRVVLADGREEVSVCMYRSLAEAWHGWGKNAYAGSKGGPLVFAMLTLCLPIGTVLPYALAIIGLCSRSRAVTMMGAVQVAAITAYRWQVDEQVEHSRWWGWTHPVAGAVMTGLLSQVCWRQFTKQGVQWSGRTYQVEQAPLVAAVRAAEKSASIMR